MICYHLCFIDHKIGAPPFACLDYSIQLMVVNTIISLGGIQGFGLILHRKALLHEYTTHRKVTGISFNDKLLGKIRQSKHRGMCQGML